MPKQVTHNTHVCCVCHVTWAGQDECLKLLHVRTENLTKVMWHGCANIVSNPRVKGCWSIWLSFVTVTRLICHGRKYRRSCLNNVWMDKCSKGLEVQFLINMFKSWLKQWSQKVQDGILEYTNGYLVSVKRLVFSLVWSQDSF